MNHDVSVSPRRPREYLAQLQEHHTTRVLFSLCSSTVGISQIFLIGTMRYILNVKMQPLLKTTAHLAPDAGGRSLVHIIPIVLSLVFNSTNWDILL